MESWLQQTLPTLGLGGILAAFMFYFYRKDVALYTSQWKGQSEQVIQVVKENTMAITKLSAQIDSEGVRARPERYAKHPHGSDAV